MTDSGQRGFALAENVAASEPIGGPEQATDSGTQWAYCVFCRELTENPVYVGSREQCSGPGVGYYADDACARTYAATSEAPDWLKECYA